MNNLHFQRWSDQLRDSGHEVFWFDILDQGYAPSLSWMSQITGWKKGFLKRRGRTFLKRKLPKLYKRLESKYDIPVAKAFEKALLQIQPDVVHSFALYLSCVPIYDVMMKYHHVQWIYSSWGSDLFNKKNKPNYKSDLNSVLKRVNYLFSDCKRDVHIAKKHSFYGKVLGIFPGGGGYHLQKMKKFILPLKKRSVILIKGNDNQLGKASVVLEALDDVRFSDSIDVVVFGSESLLISKFKQKLPMVRFLPMINQKELLELMGKSMIYIGNSISDGMPNTLLEAIVMGAFPIQSNPGGVTEEIIDNGSNGLLINDPLNAHEINALIKRALSDEVMRKSAYQVNQNLAILNLDYNVVCSQVRAAYDSIKF
ncbi:glycosyltransferase [Leeuwenhoekiella sp. H156]|uniref:glycosyltransferase n=1 Tax=Leeuwenhoekiella sp. H156 TaxID=3450128 RepID=UPI003FA4A7F9